MEKFKFHGQANKGVFFFKGKRFNYYNHTYNGVGINERTIEIPIIHDIFSKYQGKDILEIGHTLGHYLQSYNHDIVDKCEEAEGVTNIDIVDFVPSKKYDLIFSISTMEHVGNDKEFGEKPNQRKAKEAIEKCITWLKPGGQFVMTWPLGANTALDDQVYNKEIIFDELYCFGRESTSVNHWWFTSFRTGYKSDLKGVSLPIKDTEGKMQNVGIYFFLAIGIKYAKEKE